MSVERACKAARVSLEASEPHSPTPALRVRSGGTSKKQRCLQRPKICRFRDKIVLVEFSERCDVVEAVGQDLFSGSAGVIRRTVGIFLDQKWGSPT